MAKRTGFTLEELELARNIINMGAHLPPKCICGGQNYRFSLWRGKGGNGSIIYLKAQCLNGKCRYQRYFNPVSKRWGPVKSIKF